MVSIPLLYPRTLFQRLRPLYDLLSETSHPKTPPRSLETPRRLENSSEVRFRASVYYRHFGQEFTDSPPPGMSGSGKEPLGLGFRV